MEKINFCSAMQPKSLKEFPEERCEFCADYYRAADVDALLADVRRLVEAGKYRDNIDNTCRDGWDIFRAKVDLREAIAAVERHFTGKQT